MVVSETVEVNVDVDSGHKPGRFYMLVCTAQRDLEPHLEDVRTWLNGKEGRALVFNLPRGWEPPRHIEQGVRELLERVVEKCHVRVHARSLAVEPVADVYLEPEGESVSIVNCVTQFVADPLICCLAPGHVWSCPGSSRQDGSHVCLEDVRMGMAELGIAGASTALRKSQSFVRYYTRGYDPRTQRMLSIFSAAAVLQRISMWTQHTDLMEWADMFLDSFVEKLVTCIDSAHRSTRGMTHWPGGITS